MSRASSTAIKARATKKARAVAPARQAAKPMPAPRRIVQQFSELELARVAEVDEKRILVQVPSLGPTPRLAHSLTPYADFAADDQVVVAHVAGSESDLVILGRLFNPQAPPRDVRINGRKVALEANTELILRCADATVRIAHDGLVAIRGDRIVTEAQGTNRIRGGSVEIN